MQRLAFDIVNTHFQNSSTEKESLCLLLIGVAGTGKRYLVNALKGLFQCRCIITATTGTDAYNIKGQTVHSVLKLPIGSHHKCDLKGISLHRLQESMNGIDYIFIDEYSLLGQQTFGWIDRRCKQITGIHNKPLGDKSLILIGDPAQLPPVADKPLYHTKPTNEIGEQACASHRSKIGAI